MRTYLLLLVGTVALAAVCVAGGCGEKKAKPTARRAATNRPAVTKRPAATNRPAAGGALLTFPPVVTDNDLKARGDEMR